MTNLRRAGILLLAAFLCVFGLATPPAFATTTTETVARIHWLGLKQISADTNAAHFLTVWQLPQTTALVAQTLDKLSRWPDCGATNAVGVRLRPLFDDLVSSEFYLEISAPSNSQPSTINHQLSLAIRLPADRARFWRTNLTAISAALIVSNAPERIEFSRAGEWTLVGVGLDKNISQTEFAARITHLHALSANNSWLEADLKPSRLVVSLSAGGEDRGEVEKLLAINHQLSTLDSLNLTVTGESGNVHTRATLDFSHPLNVTLLPWEIPTNLIRAPLTSFTAVRGLAPWLANLPAWQKIGLTPPPDQVFVWSQNGIPFKTCLAAQLPAAGHQLAQLAARLEQNANPWLAVNSEGSITWSAGLSGIFWNNANILTPFLTCVEFNHHDYLLGGLYPPSGGASAPPPARILDSIRRRPGLLFCEFEETGSRVQDGLWMSQWCRLVFHHPQMPARAAGTIWLKTIEQQLGECSTTVTLAGPRQLALERDSTIGFNALELHLLADWLESPQFPHGLHTFLAPPDQ